LLVNVFDHLSFSTSGRTFRYLKTGYPTGIETGFRISNYFADANTLLYIVPQCVGIMVLTVNLCTAMWSAVYSTVF